MKKTLLLIGVIFLVTLTGSDNGATPNCVTCQAIDSLPDSLAIELQRMKDSLDKRVNDIAEKHDSVVAEVKKLSRKRRKITVRREFFHLNSGYWRYDWYYQNGLFLYIKKTKIK